MTTVLDEAPPAVRARPSVVTVVSDDGAAVQVPATAFTLDGFREWVESDEFPETGRITFLGGEVYIDMSQERFGTYAAVKGELTGVLIALAKRGRVGRVHPDGMWLTNEAAGVSNNPDVMFVTFDSVTTGRVVLRRSDDGQVTEVVGTPELVVEIVSPSSVGKDVRQLRERYHAAGIPEYWLIDARGVDLRFDLLRHAPDGYQPAVTPDGWRPSAAFAHEFRLTREPDAVGDWDYTLETRPLSGN